MLQYVRMATIAAASFTALTLGALYTFQRKLIYPSSLNNARQFVTSPDIPFKEVYLDTCDGERLHAFVFLQDQEPETRKTIVILSPNAGNIGHFLPVVKYIYNALGHNVFIYQYRGYGYSTGDANETGLKIDADTAIEYIKNDPILSKTSIVLYGRSLGGAVALYMAARYSKDFQKLAVIVENTFFDLPSVVPHLFPWLAYLGDSVLSYMVSEKWASHLEIQRIPENVPILFLSGTEDEVVPPSHMKTLFDLKEGVKVWRDWPTHHNDTIIANGYWETWSQFVDSYA